MNGLIIALDGMNPEQAIEMAEKLSGLGCMLKVHSAFDDPFGGGIQLTTELARHGVIMLDMKVNDTPNTVKQRIENLFRHPGVEIVTMHINAGAEAIEKAIEVTPDSKTLAGISVLTSLDRDDLRQFNITASIQDQVLCMAKMAIKHGLKTMVCSALEARMIKADPETSELKLICPGITPTFVTKAASGQKRTTSPAEAKLNGADWLVIGRGVTQQPDPRKAVDMILQEIATT